MDEDRELKQKLASTLQTLLGHFAESGNTVRESLQEGVNVLSNLSNGMLDSYLDLKTEGMLLKYRIPFGIIGKDCSSERFPLELVLTSKQTQNLKASSEALSELGKLLNGEFSLDWDKFEFKESLIDASHAPQKTQDSIRNQLYYIMTSENHPPPESSNDLQKVLSVLPSTSSPTDLVSFKV